MAYLYLILFILDTAVHLYFSKRNNQYGRAATKGVILIFLMGFYLESVDSPSWLLIVALLGSWLGDMLLLGKGVKWFTAGGIAFMVSHFFFIFTYSQSVVWSNLPIALIIVLAIVYATASMLVFKRLAQYLPKALTPPMFGYLLLNGAMNCFAWYRMISSPTLGGIITAAGALLFFVSDSSLFFVRFNKSGKQKSHFLAMLTYSVGEFLIVFGLILA